MHRASVLFALLSLAGLLTGCSASFTPEVLTPTHAAVGPVHGIVHGGRQPIVGAHIFALQASTAAYSTAAAPVASASLITVGTNTYPLQTDTSNGPTNGFNYVSTDASGGFDLAFEQNTCTTGAVVYLYSLGGDPGAGPNPAAALLAVLGVCPASGYLSDAVSGGVDMDELTTISAAYSLAPFATDALHIGAPSATDNLALLGIENAAANAGLLVTLDGSVQGANPTTPNGNGTVPQATINTLGNILAGCINSDGPGSSACSNLFGDLPITPTDTASAAVYMAQNPAITSYIIPPAIGSPYQPSLSMPPSDYTIGIAYTVGTNPTAIAIDGAGNAWVANTNNYIGGGSVSEISPNGTFISGATGYVAGGISKPVNIAIDQAGAAWITDTDTNGGIIKLNPDGTVATGTFNFESGQLTQPFGVAIDSIGNAWLTDIGSETVFKLSSSGTVLNGPNGYNYNGQFLLPYTLALDQSGNIWVVDSYSGTNAMGAVFQMDANGVPTAISGSGGFSGGGIFTPAWLAIDAAGDVWVPNLGTSTTITELSNTGSYPSGAAGYSGGGISVPVSNAIDGNGNVWIVNQGSNGSVSELTNGGAAITTAAGYTAGGTLSNPGAIAIDGSGDVWISNSTSTSNTVTELIGAAAPTITPICAGLASNATPGSKP